MKKRKPRPGSLPLKVDVPPNWKKGDPLPDSWNPGDALPKWIEEKAIDLGSALPHFMTEESKQQARDQRLTALGAARRKAEALAGDVRTDAFNDWVRRCVVLVDDPRDWTQARALYESYLAHVKTYGRRAAQRQLSIQEAATETQWGRMMATMFPKKRRTRGLYYPLRCKRG